MLFAAFDHRIPRSAWLIDGLPLFTFVTKLYKQAHHCQEPTPVAAAGKPADPVAAVVGRNGNDAEPE
jgi:hypothetical protein